MPGQPGRTAEQDIARRRPVSRRDRVLDRLSCEQAGEGGPAKHVAATGRIDDLLRLHADGEELKSAIIDLAREQQIFLEH